MVIYSIYIINKSGLLIYQRDFVSRDEKSEYKLTSNDYLRIGSVFHSMYALASRLCPRGKSSGIQFLECDSYVMRCYQSPTGSTHLTILEHHSIT